MGYAKHVGRVGALAFALGVGIGLGAAPGVALADDTGSTAGAATAGASTSGTETRQDAATPAEPDTDDGAAAEPDDADEGGEGDGSDAEDDATPQESDDEDVETEEDTTRSEDRGGDGPGQPRIETPEPTGSTSPTIESADALAEELSTTDAAPDVPATTAVDTAVVRELTEPAVTVADSAPVEAPAAEATTVALATVLAPLLGSTAAPGTPAESPALWVLLAAARRQLGQTDPASLTGITTGALTTALLTSEQAAAIRRLGDIVVGDGPTDVVATDTRAYVANSGGNSISVVDTVNSVVLQTIPLKSSPTMLAITPSGNRLYVTNEQAGTVTVISTVTNSIIRTIRVGDAPTGVAVSPGGTTVYVVNGGDGTVSKISTFTNRVTGSVFGVAQGSSSIAISADGSKIYTTSDATGEVSHFSPFSLFAGKIGGVTTGSLGLAFSGDGSRVYVADTGGSVQIIDTATREVVDSISVAAGVPFDVAVSADGTTLFVAKSDDGKLSVYDIATKAELTTIVANPYLSEAGPSMALSPDGTQLYLTDLVNDRVQVVSLIAPNSNPIAGSPVVNEPDASGVVTGSVIVIDAEANPLTHTVGTPAKGSVTVTQTNGVFSFTYTPTAAARHAAAALGAPAADMQDSFTLTVSDGHRGFVTVPITVGIAPANAAPTATARATSSWFSANVVVTVTARDADRDSLTYTASPTAKGGTVRADGNGKFTYTPTAAARHAAANSSATDADKQDTFTITVDDGHGGSTAVAVTVTIKPGNGVPTASARSVSSWFSDKVFVTVTARDPEGDPLTFTASATQKGGTVVAGPRGRFTYTPTAEARHAAAATGASDADGRDSFDVTVDDGHGGTATVTVTVRIKPANTAPSRPSVTDVSTNPNSGVVTGKITATDADGDPLTFVAPPTTREGHVAVYGDGTFVYAPTDEARAAATKRFAPSWDKTDSFTVTVDDGHGGTRSVTVRVDIAPLGYANQAPTGGSFTAGQPIPASGKVAGAVTASDPENDPLSFAGTGLTAKGSVIVDADGTFVYTPSDAARHAAAADTATPADKQDTFTVTVTDGHGGILAVPVTVAIGASNRAPTNGSYTAAADLSTGVVLGGATATDANNDPLTYTGSTTTAKGAVVVATDGGFVYTPTEPARLAAGVAGAPTSAKQDHFTVFVNDGHGGTLAIPVTVTVVGLVATPPSPL